MTPTPNPLALASIDTFRNQIMHTDLATLCASLPPQSVDMVLCDLPYGVLEATWDSLIPFDIVWSTFKRVIKPRGAIVLTAAGLFAHDLIASNRNMYKYEWIWHKSHHTGFVHAKNRPLRSFERVLVFSDGVINHESLSENRMHYYPQMTQGTPYKKKNKPNRKFGSVIGKRPSHHAYNLVNSGQRYPKDVLYFCHSKQKVVHPSQKPVALFEYLIRTYTRPGELVLDPCAGSGTTAIAAQKCGREFICGDTSAEYVELARDRLQRTDPFQAVQVDANTKQLSLFQSAAD